MAIFTNFNDEFKVIDYSASHSQLLIRSMRNKNREYNIDIILKGVSILLIPTIIKGLEIALFEPRDEKGTLLNEYGFKTSKDYRIFSLKDSNDKIYLINAMCFGIYHNKLDILESSIGRYDMENHGENIIWFAE